MYSLTKTPLNGISIETLKIQYGHLVVKYPEENHIIELQTGNTILKPEQYTLLLHPNKDLYFDRPVGNLRTLAIRDLASGQMLCEAEFGFVSGGLTFLFYHINTDQIVLILHQYIFLMDMPEEL